MSGIQSPANRYREMAVKTANSLQEAREQIARNDIAGRSRSINRCLSIISELQSCLNRQAGGEIASSLDRLYDYMKRRIFRANVDQSVQPLTEIEVLLENLRSAWGQIVTQTQETEVHTAQQDLPGRGIPKPSAPSTIQSKSLNISI
jgi:flagellar biosynthetic protein FliS